MAVNKVVYDGATLIDLTSDTVSAANLDEGVTAHDASGSELVGVRKVFDILPVANGGTGASTAEGALLNLGAIRSCVKAYLTGDASTNAVHTLKVSASSPVILDNNSIFEIANDALKVKKAGYYLASAVVVFNIDSAAAANTYGFVQLTVNGGESVVLRQVIPSVTANVNMHLVPSLVWIPENAAIKVKVYIPVSGVKKTFSSSTNIYGSYVQLEYLG